MRLLEDDQKEKRKAGRAYFRGGDMRLPKEKFHRRTERVLEILGEIGEPSIANIGEKGAEAMAVLAMHSRSMRFGEYSRRSSPFMFATAATHFTRQSQQ